jgi:hypothetical protein
LEEYDNRFNIVNSREGKEQSKAVVSAVLEEAQTVPWKRRDSRSQKEMIRRAFEKVDNEAPREVVIPYAKDMSECLDYGKDHIRRNVKKLLALIRACTRLHYLQRPVITNEDDDSRALIAFPEDLLMVLSMGERTLESTFSVLTKSQLETYEICNKLYTEGREITSNSITTEFSSQGKDISQPASHKRLQALHKRGLLNFSDSVSEEKSGSENKRRGKPLDVYVPLGHETFGSVPTKLRDPPMIEKYERSFQKFLNNNKTIFLDKSEKSELSSASSKRTDFGSLGFSKEVGFIINRTWIDPLTGHIENLPFQDPSKPDERVKIDQSTPFDFRGFSSKFGAYLEWQPHCLQDKREKLA